VVLCRYIQLRLSPCLSPSPPNLAPPPATDAPTRSNKWVPVSRAIFNQISAQTPMLAGPEWSHLGMDSTMLEWWLGSMWKTLNILSFHLYQGDVFSNPSIEDLLAEKNSVSSTMPSMVRRRSAG
jgi:hypothetical protein